MKVEGGDEGMIRKIVDKQFSMIGEKVTIEEIPEDGIITVNDKKMKWYEHYKWDTMEQYEKWKQWASLELKLLGETTAARVLTYVDFRYGLTVRYKKEGELF